MGGDLAGGGRAAGRGGLGRVDPAGGGAGDAERAAVAEVVGEVDGGDVQKAAPHPASWAGTVNGASSGTGTRPDTIDKGRNLRNFAEAGRPHPDFLRNIIKLCFVG